MDNVCHTLVGAALAQTGLKRRTGLGAATLMIGANFPDIDVIAVPLGRAIEWRRGWTHGVLALAVLPFVLTAAVLAWDRYVRPRRGRTRAPVVPREVLLLATIAILTHPVLDWMNSYGLRWLMPFSGRWFYGDALFIVDPWLLLALGLGVWLSRRREQHVAERPWRPARVALATAGAYVVAMLGLQAVAERVARRALAASPRVARALFVTPSVANPLRWQLIADDGERFWPGTVLLAPGAGSRVALAGDPIVTNAADPAAVAAAGTETGRRFLGWARMPYYRVERGAGATRVTITDARYGASVEVQLE